MNRRSDRRLTSSNAHAGLERAKPLAQDIEWFAATYKDVTVPEVGPYGKAYSAFLKEIHARSLPAFVCHYYNHYFAHTAGGRMIGKKMAAMLLDGHELHFYQVRRREKGACLPADDHPSLKRAPHRRSTTCSGRAT